MVVDKTGNVLVTGFYAGTLTFSGSNAMPLQPFGGSDIFIVKYDPAGAVLWTVRAGGKGDDLGNGLAVDQEGSVYVTGQIRGEASFESTSGEPMPVFSSDNSDAFIAKYSPEGQCLWVANHGAASDATGTGIAVSPSGDEVFIAGKIGNQAFLRKLSAASGRLGAQMETSAVSPGDPEQRVKPRSQSVAVDAAGHVYLAGDYAGATVLGGASLPGFGHYQAAFVAQLDAENLHCDWSTHSGHGNPPPADGYAECWGVVLDPSGACCYTARHHNL